jgi:enamine deaminase RidA (YjgF/YER057c/UK114 family)
LTCCQILNLILFDTVSKEAAMETTPSPESAGVALPHPWELPSTVRQRFEFVHVHSGIAYIAGHGPVSGTEVLMTGKVGHGLTVEDGYHSARLTALAVTASLKRALPSLESVTWLRATVYVNAVPGLEGPALTRVADGFSDVINEIFGDRGRHARAAMGAAALAFDVPTIVEGMVAVSTVGQSATTWGDGA